VELSGLSGEAAYVFHRIGANSWDAGTRLVATDGQAGHFGWSVAISGDYAIVGSYRGGGTGAAYVFCRTDVNVWDPGTRLLAADAEAEDLFGASVAICGDHAIVGATHEDQGGRDAGATYVFSRIGANTWDLGAKLLSPDIESEDGFGRSVGIDADSAIVSSSGHSGAYVRPGAAYIVRPVAP
jgi:hypothetical protein